ncbi:MAG: multidrug effflux MFS transporter [Rhodospirillales bacterium]
MTAQSNSPDDRNNEAPARQTDGGWLVPAVLVTCTGVSILSTDLYLPSLPHLPELLDSNTATVQLTLSLNLAAFSLAQLLHGPLSDRIGRRRLLLIGLVGFCLASLVCAFANSIGMLLAGRIGQGLTASVGSVVILLTIRDLYADSKAMQVLAIYGLALGLVPAVGPLLGGYIFIWLGWQANFLLLAVAIVLVFVLVYRVVPETGRRNPLALRPGHMAASYLALLTNRRYLRYFVPLSLSFGALFAFLTEGPFLLIERLGVATEHYGYYHAIVVAGFILGSLIVGRLARRITPETFVRLGLTAGCLGGLTLLIPVLLGHTGLIALMSGMSLYAVSLGFLMASGPICLLETVRHAPQGPASALIGSAQMAAGSLAGLLVAMTHDGSGLPMTATMGAFLTLAVLAYVALSPGRSGKRVHPVEM